MQSILAEMRLADGLDIAIVAVLLWMLIIWLRTTRARPAFVGLGILGALYLLVQQLELRLTVRLLQGFFAAGVLMLIVIFQDDLRRLFERIAVAGLRPRRARPGPDVVEILSRAVARLAECRIGALIVLPGRDPLGRHMEGGVYLRGRVSDALLDSIFDPHSDGHDGAVLIEGNEVARFGVHLPLSSDRRALGSGGTRHAAALGIAERSDAFCIVVSEERGTISIARDGVLRRLDSADALAGELSTFLRAAHPRRRASGLGLFARGLPSHWREGLLASVLALVLWAGFIPGDTVVNVAFPVPVEVENLPEGWVLDGVEPPEVEITLRGHRRDLYLAGPGNVQIRVDALLVQLGRRTFDLSTEQVDHPDALGVSAISPRKVRLRVSPVEGG